MDASATLDVTTENTGPLVVTECFLGKKELVGGFNPFEKYSSKWESSPNWGENKNCLKPPPRDLLQFVLVFVRAGLEVLMSR